MKRAKKSEIVFKGLIVDGKHQKEWFKIFDLFDKIFRNEQNMGLALDFEDCSIENFNIDFRKLPKGSSKYSFAKFIFELSEQNKILDFDLETGKITYFKNK